MFRSLIQASKLCRVKILKFIIPLLCNFIILGQWNAQNMPRYYAVEQGENTDGKRNNKMDSQNNLTCVVFPPFLGFAFSTPKFKALFFSVGYNNGFVDIIFVFRAGLNNQYVRSLDEAVGCISKTERQNIRNQWNNKSLI